MLTSFFWSSRQPRQFFEERKGSNCSQRFIYKRSSEQCLVLCEASASLPGLLWLVNANTLAQAAFSISESKSLDDGTQELLYMSFGVPVTI